MWGWADTGSINHWLQFPLLGIQVHYPAMCYEASMNSSLSNFPVIAYRLIANHISRTCLLMSLPTERKSKVLNQMAKDSGMLSFQLSLFIMSESSVVLGLELFWDVVSFTFINPTLKLIPPRSVFGNIRSTCFYLTHTLHQALPGT